MNELSLFGSSVALSSLAWAVVLARYAWPWLKRMKRADAARPILLLHTFRFVGLAFLVPGVVSPNLQAGFAVPAAYGDLIAVVLAWAAILALGRPLEVFALWAFNVWGTADLLFAIFQGLVVVRISPSALGAAYFIPTLLVPLLLATHAIVFMLLLARPAFEPQPRVAPGGRR